MSKEGNDYRDEFIQAMEDLQFRLEYKDEVEALNAGGNGLTISDCFFNGICASLKFHEFCLSCQIKEYNNEPRLIDGVLEHILKRFFDRRWAQEKCHLISCDYDCDFGLQQAQRHCAEIIDHIAVAYVHRLRDLCDYHELIETDYFSKKLMSGDEVLVK